MLMLAVARGDSAEADVGDDKLTPLYAMPMSSLDSIGELDMCAHLSTALMSSANMTSPPRDDDVLGLTPMSPLSSLSLPPSPFTECTQSCHCCHTLTLINSDFTQYKHANQQRTLHAQRECDSLRKELQALQCAFDDHKSQCTLTVNRQTFQIAQLKDSLKHLQSVRSTVKATKSEASSARDGVDMQTSSAATHVTVSDDVTSEEDTCQWINDNDGSIANASSTIEPHSKTLRSTIAATKSKRVTPDCTLRKCVATRKSLIEVAPVLQRATDIQKQQQQTIRKQSTQIDALTKRNETLLAKVEQMKSASSSATPRRSVKRKRCLIKENLENEVSERRRQVMSANEISLTDDDVSAMSLQIEAELFVQDEEQNQNNTETALQDHQQVTHLQPSSSIDMSSTLTESELLTQSDTFQRADDCRRHFRALISTAIAFLSNPYSVASAMKAHFRLIVDRIRSCRCTSAVLPPVWPISAQKKISECKLLTERECTHSDESFSADQFHLDEAVQQMFNVVSEQYEALLESNSIDAADKVWSRGITMIADIAIQHEQRCSETTSQTIIFNLESPTAQIIAHICLHELFSTNNMNDRRKQSLLVAYATLLQRVGEQKHLLHVCQQMIYFYPQIPLSLLDVFARFDPTLFAPPSTNSTESIVISSLRLVIACAISKHKSEEVVALSSILNATVTQLSSSSAFDLWQPIIQEILSHLQSNKGNTRKRIKNNIVFEESLSHLSCAMRLFYHSVGLAISYTVMTKYFIPLIATLKNNRVNTFIYSSLADLSIYAATYSHTTNTKKVILSLIEFLVEAANNPKSTLLPQQVHLLAERIVHSMIAANCSLSPHQLDQLKALETKMKLFVSTRSLSEVDSTYLQEYQTFVQNGSENVLFECSNKRKIVTLKDS